MKAYKVVTPTRFSISLGPGKYALRYPKGAIVEAPPGTLGIMCFKTLDRARAWVGLVPSVIIEVQGLTRPRFPRYICKSLLIWRIDTFYKIRRSKKRLCDREFVGKVPEGTVCFDKVKVGDVVLVH